MVIDPTTCTLAEALAATGLDANLCAARMMGARIVANGFSANLFPDPLLAWSHCDDVYMRNIEDCDDGSDGTTVFDPWRDANDSERMLEHVAPVWLVKRAIDNGNLVYVCAIWDQDVIRFDDGGAPSANAARYRACVKACGLWK